MHRFLLIYFGKFNNRILIIIYCLYIFLFISYVLFINLFYHDIYFHEDDWQNYPIYLIYFFYLLIFNPLAIYCLNKKKNNIKKDYIFSSIILFTGFFLEIVNIFKRNIIDYYNSLKFYTHFLTTFMSLIAYYSIPLIEYYRLNLKKIQDEEELVEINFKNLYRDDDVVCIYEKNIVQQ